MKNPCAIFALDQYMNSGKNGNKDYKNKVV